MPHTKSQAARFGLVHCPGCNAHHLPAQDIPADVPCAWCWNEDDKIHYRYVKVEVYKRWRFEHGLPDNDEDEIETSPQTRGALAHPPAIADTEPAPPFTREKK